MANKKGASPAPAGTAVRKPSAKGPAAPVRAKEPLEHPAKGSSKKLLAIVASRAATGGVTKSKGTRAQGKKSAPKK